MEYKSELYETVPPPAFLNAGEGDTLTSVGLVIALSAIALSVAMIVTQNFMGAPRAQEERSLGKSPPVADADALLSKIAALSESKTGLK